MGLGDRQIFVYDQRAEEPEAKVITLPPNTKYDQFKENVTLEFHINTENEAFVVSTTNRDEVDDDLSVSLLEDGDTLYILHSMEQELVSQTKQKVDFLPHYDTLVKSGMYEYYNSEGKNPLPFAFAELIDNSLAATAHNEAKRDIEVKLVLDDKSPEKSLIFVIDNGRGMTSWQLNNWAIYRLSKFIRQDKAFKPVERVPDSPSSESSPKKAVPRSLNSEISYFGVGGKQAIFFIGNGTRMITKPKESIDVHELCISKEQFEKKEQNKEFVYSGEIRNRKLADSSHLNDDDMVLKKIIAEEEGKECFTCVVISGIASEHILYLKENFDALCTQLAHIYHYYVHGPMGNDGTVGKKMPTQIENLDIQVCLSLNDEINVKNLREIENDMQTKYIQSGHSTFEFKALVENVKYVEGIIRYHPFLYDQETYPVDPYDSQIAFDDETSLIQTDHYPARGRRPIFECYWNGRLIPYTFVRDFEWCIPPKKQRNLIPVECYNRISGVLWTNEAFQVSTNKLTFLDLENRIKDNSTVFQRVINGQEKRGLIEKQFNEWLLICHEKCDKQILFKDFQGHIARTDQQKIRQFPWAVYNSIEWDGKHFSKGQKVRTLRTVPVVLGTVKRFFLYGEFDENDVYATGGDFEIQMEPISMYGDSKSFALCKLDRKADDETILKAIDQEEEKLPHRLIVNWPEGDQLYSNEKRPAGKTIGAIKVEISNRRGELINKVPGTTKKLLIDLKLFWHSPKGEVVLAHFISAHAKTWPYWFRKMENVKELGSYTLSLQAVVNDTETEIAGKVLPSHHLKFFVTEGVPEKFSLGVLEGPFRVGISFNIPLEFQDRFGNPSKPTEMFRPLLQASGLSLDFSSIVVKGSVLTIKGVTALGTVESSTGKNYTLNVKVIGLEKETHSMKIRLLPGPPVLLGVKPETELIEVENGSVISFDIMAFDASGNSTMEPKLVVTCKLTSKTQKDLPTFKVDVSATGKGTLTSPPILLQKFSGNEMVIAKIQANRSEIPFVEKQLKILPSRRASSLRITYHSEEGKKCDLEPDCELTWTAGEAIKGLEFLVYDEGGRPIKITPSIASKLKVNWVSRGVKDFFMAGKLPDITTPAAVSQPMYCDVALTDSFVIDFGFTIKPVAGEAHNLRAYCESGSRLKLGETLSSNILVDIVDKHSNRITKINSKSMSNLIVSAEDLDMTRLQTSMGKGSTFVVSNVYFTDGKLGPKEVIVKWNEFKDTISLEVAAGAPTKLSYPNYNIAEFVTLSEDRPLPHPIIVQLCDADDNAVNVPGIKVQLGTDEALKIFPVVHATKTGDDGKVYFGQIKVSLKQKQKLPKCPAQICPNACHGVFSLCAKAVVNRQSIIGPLLKLHIPCDRLKPVFVRVNHIPPKTYIVGKELPDYEVAVLSEEGSPIQSLKSAQLKMKVSPVVTGRDSSPPKEILNSASDCSNGVCFFRKKGIPHKSGKYTIEFSYTQGATLLSSELIIISVVAGLPRKINPEIDPGLPAVSNTAKFASRCLVKNLKLHLLDDKGNVAGAKCNGTLLVQIMSKDNQKGEIPKMVGGVTSIEVPICGGQVSLQNVTIEENSPGIDGKEYILRCTPKLSNAPGAVDLPPYDVRFIFCNDSDKQAEISSLSKERDNLLSIIKTYQTLFDTSKQLLKELEEAARNAAIEEHRLKSELKQKNYNPALLTTVEKVKQALSKLNLNRTKIQKVPKRVFGMTAAPEETDVLGKIGQLAYVENEDVAKVLSWHMQSDMDCVVTRTMDKARDLHRKMSGRMQLLPLDSIYRRNLPDWSKPIMHSKIKNYSPPGNPIYARDCLIFPIEPENCKLIFGMLLGDTIILDTLEDATHYREILVKHMFCPTLLTRTGERIRSNGKFGGQQNKAPSTEKLRGLVFGEPPQMQFIEIDQQIEMLESLRIAVEKSIQTRNELHEQQRQENSAEMQQKAKEYNIAQKKLRDIESKLLESSTFQNGNNSKHNAISPSQASKRKEQKESPKVPKGKFDERDTTLNGLGGLGLTRSQLMKLKSQSSEPSSPIYSPPSRKKRKT